MFAELFQFAFGLTVGIFPAYLYGRFGGDDAFEVAHPNLKQLLHWVHHWWLGLIMMLTIYLASLHVFTALEFPLGFSTGVTLDDAVFHSFCNYFKRKSLKE